MQDLQNKLLVALCSFISDGGIVCSCACSLTHSQCWLDFCSNSYTDVKSDTSESKVRMLKHGRKKGKHGNFVHSF